MPDSHKKYKATLGKHTEEWTQAEHDNAQKVFGARFHDFTVELLQVDKPADVPTGKAARTSTNADAPAA
jgi:hypothetical protein